MRIASNKDSVTRGEVSILAVVETLFAISLVFYLSIHFNTLRWLVVSICVTPLLLLRTEESTRLGIRWFDRWALSVEKIANPDNRGFMRGLCGIVCGIIGVSIIAFAARFCATIIVAVRTPITALLAIPTNWSRVVLATDFLTEPAFVPEHPSERLSTVLGGYSTARRGCALLFFAPVLIPVLSYRWCFKATSIIYAPLVFVAHSTFKEDVDLRAKLELIKRGDLSRIRVWYGVVAIILFLVKLVLMINLEDFANWWNGNPISCFLALYVAPKEIPRWQIAELANSVLAIGSMLFARRALLGYELLHPWPEKPVTRLLGLVSGLRWVIALYTILCTGYITMRAAQNWHWPALGEKWLPW